ncbi:protein kinase [Streptomyces harbinensis]|uniref:serine/threonine-protein kinase n=1 Tax=Streptomyces harbinensis TaxID=1176198 RepID=UPI0015926326|nr:serine/threonine-protein kinase [Streptomyces harbinensis]QKV68040.1 protein kinase [Streptomyces harbinensis]
MTERPVVHGRYQLLELIGRGGMGEVWSARDEALDRRVAVKCLKPLGSGRDASALRVLRQRFRREARVAAGLQHRGITVVHDFGETEDGLLYLVMELLIGRNLSQLLGERRGAPLPVADVTDIAAQTAAALAYTHEQGVVHRDLKPANVMRLTDGTVKICDFGIARLAHDIGFSSKLTGFGMAMGTPHYMSPEQIAGLPVDHRGDLYSLGCVLYELATGAPPFDLGDPWAILVGHRDQAPAPPRSLRPELPEPLDRLILALLAKRPEDRPSDAAVLVRELVATAGQGGAGPPLPEWTRGMRAGSRASGSWSLRLPPPDRSAGLTGPWTGPVATALLHPSPAPEYLAVLAGRHRAALGLGRLGRWPEAYEAHRALAAERERVLGAGHPDTLASQYELAHALRRLARWDRALAAYRPVAAAGGPLALDARFGMGVCLGRLGHLDRALALYQELIAVCAGTFGDRHPRTLSARHGRGISLGRLGRWEEALAEARQVWSLRARVLGPHDPDTLVSRREIAIALGWLGRWKEALTEYRLVRRAREETLGEAHPDTVTSRNDEAHCLEQLGRARDAAPPYRRSADGPGGRPGNAAGGRDGVRKGRPGPGG